MNEEMIVVFKEQGFRIDLGDTKNKSFFFDEELYRGFKNETFKTLFHFGFMSKKDEMSASFLFLHRLSARFIESLSQDPTIELNRSATPLFKDEILKLLTYTPFSIGSEFITVDWIEKIFQELSEVFEEEMRTSSQTVENYLKEQNELISTAGRVFFHLVEHKSEEFPFAFLATYATKKNEEKKASHTPLKNALLEFKEENNKLLSLLKTVSKVSNESRFISELMETGELFSPLKLSKEEAYLFLKEVPLYEQCGILCRIPNWWRKKTIGPKISISIGDKEPAKVGMDAILSFKPEIFLGEDKISKEELEALLSQTNGLDLLKGKWIEVDYEKLQATLAAYESALKLANQGDLTLADAMRSQLQFNQMLATDEEVVELEVSNGEWLKSVRDRLLSPKEIESLSLGDDFKATLRHYQQEGFDWLRLMNSLGFGALLADDMGLGKTVQILAFLEYKRQVGDSKTLLIVPTSLISN